VKLSWDNLTQDADIVVTETGAFDNDEDLETAVTVSLFTYANDPTQPKSQNRFGWWGDTYADTPGDKIGSLLWTLRRKKVTPVVLSQCRTICEDALAWMLQDKVAKSITVVTTRLGPDVIKAAITIERVTGGPWQAAWEIPTNGL